MKNLHMHYIVLPLYFFIVLAGCKSRESHWQDAQSTNTVESYEEFIEDYPQSPFEEDAKKKIIELEFEKANEQNTIVAYEKFIEKYPENPYVEKAKSISKQLYFQVARQQNTIESYENFINRYPSSTEAEEAKSKTIELRYDEVRGSNSVPDYEQFIEQYPQTSYASEAQNEILNIYAEKIGLSKSLKNKEAIENKMVNSILKNGFGNRLVIASILPEKNAYTGSIAMEPVEGSSSHSTAKPLYPKDELKFSGGQFGMSPSWPLGDKSIWRFLGGEIGFGDHTFIGTKNEPLTFMLLKNAGFVYLHGKGTVKKNGNLIATLP